MFISLFQVTRPLPSQHLRGLPVAPHPPRSGVGVASAVYLATVTGEWWFLLGSNLHLPW